METIGKRILNIRKYLKLNQSDFGGKMGFKSNTISDIENDITQIQPYHVKLLYHVYSVSENYIFYGKLPMLCKDTALERVAENKTHYSIPSNCPADSFCKEVCRACMDSDPDDRKSIKQLTDILRSHDEGTKLAIKQNLDIFRRGLIDNKDFKTQELKGEITGGGQD